MKLSKIVERVDAIREIAPLQPELATWLERELWSEVLHAEAMGKGSPAKAAAALETESINFIRVLG